MCGLDRADLGDRHLPVREHLEHERLELFVTPVAFVHEQHRRLRLLRDRLEQRAPQQEGLGKDLVLLLVHRAAVVPGLLELDVQELLLIVPLVEGGRGVEPLVALEPDQVRPEHPRHDLRDLGLPDARGPLDQERLAQAHRQVHRRRNGRVRHIVRRLHQLLEFSNLVTHVHSLYMKPRVVLGRVHVEGHREVEGDALDALRPRVHDGARPGVAGELGELREDLSREDDGRPLRPLEDRHDDRLSPAAEGGEQRRHDRVGRLRLIAERDQRGTRPRLERRDADGDRAPLALLGPRVHGEAHPEPGQRVADRGVVLARDDDNVLDVWQQTFDGPADDRLALELKEELLPPHAAGESGGQHDARDHARSGEARRRSRRAGGAFGRGWTRPVPAASHADLTHPGGAQPPRGMRAHAAWSSHPPAGRAPAPADYAPARFTASVIARFAKTRQRCDLYSTEPCRSAWTSTPSAAFCAAASIAAASSFLPFSAASTPLARTALVPAPVTPTPALTHTPCLSSVTAAQTPTTAKREAGCGNFMYAAPELAGSSGTRTWTRSSRSLSAVAMSPRNHWSTPTFRLPFGPSQTSSAPRAITAAGQSAAGSACASEPPIVPLFLTAGSPMTLATSASTGDRKSTRLNSSHITISYAVFCLKKKKKKKQKKTT